MNDWLKLVEMIIKTGSWALGSIIVLMWLAGEYGLAESQSKRAADTIKEHAAQSQQTQATLDKIVLVLEEQRRIQAQAALIACFKEAKWDSERTECIKKFPIK